MKKISLILVSLLMVGNLVMAQNRGNGRMNPRETAQEMTDRMVKAYSLNDEQKTQLQTVNQQFLEDAQKRFEAVRGQAGNNPSGERPRMTPEQREKMQQEMKDSREAYNAQIQKILTEEQYKSFLKDEQERQANRRR